MIRLVKVSIALITTALIYSCDKAPQEEQPEAESTPVALTEEERAQLDKATTAAWRSAEPALKQTEDNARQLLKAVDALLEEPSSQSLEQAQARWQETALSYQPLRIYAALADLKPENFASLRELNFAIAAQPIQPGYLDSVGEYAYSGLVHDISLPITPENLRHQHGMTDEEDASLGIYALQFMLFGDAPAQPRTAEDYTARTQLTADDREQGFTDPAELPQNRRRLLLATQTQILLEDIQRLRTAWQPQAENSLYQSFVALNPMQRHNLLLFSTRLKINELMGLLAGTPDDTSDEGQAVEKESESETTITADATTLSHAATQLEYIVELLADLQVTEQLQQNVQTAHQLLIKVQAEPSAATAEQVLEALQSAMNLLEEEIGAD